MASRIAAQALKKATALRGECSCKFGCRVRQFIAPNVAVARYPLDNGGYGILAAGDAREGQRDAEPRGFTGGTRFGSVAV